MKFSAAIVLAAVTSVAAEKNIRVPQSVSNEPTNADVRVTIHGMKGDLSDEDIEIVNQSIVKAYNQAYSTSGYSMNSFTAEVSTPIEDTLGWDPYCRLCPPAKETMVTSKVKTEGQLFLGRVQVSWDPYCRLCPPDVETTIKNLADMHQTFENKFCAGLRESGSDALTEARDCSFSFLNMPGQAEENLPIVEQSNGQNSEAQLTLQGTLNDLSEKDLQVLDESIVSAYNEAFSSAGYKLESFKTVADLELPSNVSWDPYCRLCPPDTDAVKVGSAKLIVASAATLGWDPYCRLCPPAEDATVAATPELSDAKLAFLHTAFEKTLCAKLQNSGEANFANVSGCSFRFVFAPVSEATTAQA
jgi:hypothetical protein